MDHAAPTLLGGNLLSKLKLGRAENLDSSQVNTVETLEPTKAFPKQRFGGRNGKK